MSAGGRPACGKFDKFCINWDGGINGGGVNPDSTAPGGSIVIGGRAFSFGLLMLVDCWENCGNMAHTGSSVPYGAGIFFELALNTLGGGSCPLCRAIHCWNKLSGIFPRFGSGPSTLRGGGKMVMLGGTGEGIGGFG